MQINYFTKKLAWFGNIQINLFYSFPLYGKILLNKILSENITENTLKVENKYTITWVTGTICILK